MTRDIAPYSRIRCERRLTEPGWASDLETSCALGARKKKRRHDIILYDAMLPCKRGARELPPQSDGEVSASCDDGGPSRTVAHDLSALVGRGHLPHLNLNGEDKESGRLPREPRCRLRAADQRQESRHLRPVLARGEREPQRMKQRAPLAAAGARQGRRPGL